MMQQFYVVNEVKDGVITDKYLAWKLAPNSDPYILKILQWTNK